MYGKVNVYPCSCVCGGCTCESTNSFHMEFLRISSNLPPSDRVVRACTFGLDGIEILTVINMVIEVDERRSQNKAQALTRKRARFDNSYPSHTSYAARRANAGPALSFNSNALQHEIFQSMFGAPSHHFHPSPAPRQFLVTDDVRQKAKTKLLMFDPTLVPVAELIVQPFRMGYTASTTKAFILEEFMLQELRDLKFCSATYHIKIGMFREPEMMLARTRQHWPAQSTVKLNNGVVFQPSTKPPSAGYDITKFLNPNSPEQTFSLQCPRTQPVVDSYGRYVCIFRMLRATKEQLLAKFEHLGAQLCLDKVRAFNKPEEEDGIEMLSSNSISLNDTLSLERIKVPVSC